MGGSGSTGRKFQAQAQHAVSRGDARKLRDLLARLRKTQGSIAFALLDPENSLLHYAVAENSMSCLKLLLQEGANINQSDASGHTPLHLAVQRGNADLTRFLLKNGADINAAIADTHYTPLLLAIVAQVDALVPILLDAGADVNAIDKSKRSPLFRAVERQDERLVQLLLDRGADIMARNEAGRTVVLQAKADANRALLKLLTDKFCKLSKSEVPTVFATADGLTGPLTAGKEPLEEPSTSDESTTRGDAKCCKVCWEHAADTVLLWCGHVAVCMYCTQFLELCPMCCTRIDKVHRVFIS